MLQCIINTESGEPGDDLTAEAIEYCQKLGSKATKVSEIISSKDKAVYAAIQAAVSEVNKRAVSNAQKIQKWVVLEKDFSVGGGELGECWVGGRGWFYLWVLDRQHKQSLKPAALLLCCAVSQPLGGQDGLSRTSQLCLAARS